MTAPLELQPLYIMALRPCDRKIDAALVSAARQYAATSRDYILGDEPGQGLPHVTLSFFRAADDNKAVHVLGSWPRLVYPTFSVTIGTLKHKPDATEPGMVWSHLDLDRSWSLLNFQQDARAHLEILEFTPLTRVETYDPHFTLARREGSPGVDRTNPPGLPAGVRVECYVDVMRGTEIGVGLSSVTSPPERILSPHTRLVDAVPLKGTGLAGQIPR